MVNLPRSRKDTALYLHDLFLTTTNAKVFSLRRYEEIAKQFNKCTKNI